MNLALEPGTKAPTKKERAAGKARAEAIVAQEQETGQQAAKIQVVHSTPELGDAIGRPSHPAWPTRRVNPPVCLSRSALPRSEQSLG